jgi:hypothetical protein
MGIKITPKSQITKEWLASLGEREEAEMDASGMSMKMLLKGEYEMEFRVWRIEGF